MLKQSLWLLLVCGVAVGQLHTKGAPKVAKDAPKAPSPVVDAVKELNTTKLRVALAALNNSIKNAKKDSPLAKAAAEQLEEAMFAAVDAASTTSEPYANDMLKAILAAGANVNAQEGRAIRTAAYNRKWQMVRTLVDQSHADVNLGGHFQAPALSSAAGAGSVEMVDYLLKAGANVNQLYDTGIRWQREGTPLRAAYFNNHLDVVKRLLQEPNVEVGGISILPDLIDEFNEADLIARVLQSAKNYNLNGVNRNRKSALIAAVQKNSEPLAKMLLAVPGIDLNVQDGNNKTALITAVENKFVPIIYMLLAGPGIDPNKRDSSGKTALIYAVEKELFPVVQQMLSMPGIDLNVQDGNGRTAFMYAVEKNNMPLVALFIKDFEDHKRNPDRLLYNKVDNIGRTALALAVKNKDAQMVNGLLHLPFIDLTTKDKNGYSLIQLAMGDKAITDLLTQAGAK